MLHLIFFSPCLWFWKKIHCLEKIRVKCMFSITVPSSSCPWRFGSEYPWFMTHLSPELTARLSLGNKGITGFLYPRGSCPPPRPLSGFATSCTPGLFLVVLPPCHLVATRGALAQNAVCPSAQKTAGPRPQRIEYRLSHLAILSLLPTKGPLFC